MDHTRLLDVARQRGDLTAVAILSADRDMYDANTAEYSDTETVCERPATTSDTLLNRNEDRCMACGGWRTYHDTVDGPFHTFIEYGNLLAGVR